MTWLLAESPPLPRCRLALFVVVLGIASLGLGTSHGQVSTRPPSLAGSLTEASIIERVTERIDRGLKYLSHKQRADGGWADNQAINAVALLAFLGRGHVPGRGPYRDVLAKGKRFLLDRPDQSAAYVSFGTMYEHGLATLALAELYGMDADPRLETRLRKAVDLIVQAQSPQGGWRYQPDPSDHDLSVTVMQIVALRAALNAEVRVPERVIRKASAYVRSCASPEGGFGYQPGSSMSPQTTAAGIVSLQLLGQHEDATVRSAIPALEKVPIAWDASGPQYFYYFHYYAIQATYQVGGKTWDGWHTRVRELLLKHQGKDGSWNVPPGTAEQTGTVDSDRIYWTAMACLVLDVYLHYLPAYQR